MLRHPRLGFAMSMLLLACSSSGGNGEDMPDAGTASSTQSTCGPTPARCDDLGDERPGRLSEHVAAYDPERRELLVFGGTDTIPEACAVGGAVELNDETWIYDEPCRKWTRVAAVAPSAVGRHMAAWGDGSVWVFGGRYRAPEQTSGAYELYGDLHRFDMDKRQWSQVEVEGASPAPRVNGTLIWDSWRNKLWLFGGNTSSDGGRYEARNDVWSFEPSDNRWTEEDIEGTSPPPRLFHAALYDAMSDELVIFGGADETAFSLSARYFNDIWALSLSELTWTLLGEGTASGLRGRFWPQLVHDTERDRFVMFGGHDDGNLGNRNDTWRFHPNELTWTRISEGDTFNTPANGVCDFPPDFTNVDLDVPERRSAHTMAYSEGCGRILLFGGKTDCGAIDDVWRLRGDDWAPMLEATEGEACLRWRDDPETCGDMCF
jgi:hypothetical protein